MAFLSGTVSFSRHHVAGGAPKRLDDRLLEKLREHRIGTQRVMRADHEEVGWIGGRHLLDGEFDIEKNVLLDCLHCGLRIDVSKIPPERLRAYVQMELDELRRKNGNGHAPGRIKREAVEAARRRADEEIKKGRYRRQRQAPVLLDSRNDVLFLGETRPTALQRVSSLFKETVGKRLEPMTAGYLAYAWAERAGLTRMLEGLEPAPFVRGDGDNGRAEVCWTASDPTSRDYLGNEFLLWLWFTLSERGDTIALPDNTDAAVVMVKQLVLECPRAEMGRQTIACDGPTQLPESRRAVQSGKLPRKAGLIVSRQGAQYEFLLQAETFNVTSAVLPKIDAGGNGNGRGRAFAEERIEQIRHLAETVDLLFAVFLKLRLSSAWPAELAAVRAWLSGE
ncbi:MAG: hypothetical protein ACE5E1_11030 [Phycisphaerae bacterium]